VREGETVMEKNPVKQVEDYLGIQPGIPIRAKDRKKGGKLIPGVVEEGQRAEIVKNKSIRLFGTYQGEAYDRTFKIGDIAEHDSFNLRYLGTIVSISEKCVGIKDKYDDKVYRLDLYTFNWRNRKLDVAEVERQNTETSHHI